ncbi:hypothetical protein AgCh_028454 [Apium graveolens]
MASDLENLDKLWLCRQKDVHQGPVNPSLLHLQHTHRALNIWRLGGGDMLKFRQKNPNNEDDLPPLDLCMVHLLQSTGFYGVARVASLQLDWCLISALVERWRPETHTFHLPMGEVTITLQDVGVLLGLHVDGDAVISDVTPSPDMSWRSYVAELFGRDPDPKRDMNGSRVRLSFITSCAPAHLPHDASANDIRFQVLCYLVHIFGGVLFTDHSGGLFHPMFLHFIRDLDKCGDYAWGAAVLAYLYRELCKTSKKDVDEVAGCLLLFQLWAWERLPTLAAIHTSSILFDARFWEGQVAAPCGLRWLHGHSYTSTGGRTVSAIQTLLDGLGPSQFKWQPYSVDVISELPAYCFTGERIWRYCGPLIYIFIVELHYPDRVARQFGLVQTILVDVVYSEAEHSTNLRGNDKIRWIQKHAASRSIWAHRLDHLFVGDAIVAESSVPEPSLDLMFRQISERTQDVLPDVSRYADQCCDFFRAYTLNGFDEMPVEVRRARQARVLVDEDPVSTELGADGIPFSDFHDVPESSTHDRSDPMATDLGDDRDPPVRDSVAHTVSVHVPGSSTRVQHDSRIPDRPTEHVSVHFSIPSFSLHVTPTPPTDPDDGTNFTSSQSTQDQSSQDQSSQDRPRKYGHFYTFQGKRRSKRTANPPNCGIDGQKSLNDFKLCYRWKNFNDMKFGIIPVDDDDDVEMMFGIIVSNGPPFFVEIYLQKNSICPLIETSTRVVETSSRVSERSGSRGFDCQTTSSMYVGGDTVSSRSLDAYDVVDSALITREETLEPMELREGIIFDSKKVLMHTVRDFHIRNHQEIKVVRSSDVYWIVVCKNKDSGCEWSLKARLRKSLGKFQIMETSGPHTCLRTTVTQDHPNLTSYDILELVKDQIVVNPMVKEKVLMATVKSIFGYQSGRKKIRDAKKLTMEKEHGSWEGSYEDLPFLMEAFQCFNVGTKVDWFFKEDETEDRGSLERLFWAFKPCIDGFEHCMPVIHIDGTYLYGPYSGVLLSAVAVDGFSHILPFAFAIVEFENVSSWGWFMDRLRKFVAGRRHGICAISDRHAGIIAAMQQIGWCEPLDHHRFCIRHLAANFCTAHRRKGLKNRLVELASQVQEKKFEFLWEQLLIVEPRTAEWFEDKPLSKWSSAYDGGKRYGMMTTNHAKSWNNVILDARKLPISSLVRALFLKTVEYFDERRLEIATELSKACCAHLKLSHESLVDKIYRLDNASMVYNGVFEPIPSKGDSRWPTGINFPTVIHNKNVEKKKGRRKSTRYQNAMDFQAPKGKK